MRRWGSALVAVARGRYLTSRDGHRGRRPESSVTSSRREAHIVLARRRLAVPPTIPQMP